MEAGSQHELYVPPDAGTNLWFLGQLVTFKIRSPQAQASVFQLITPLQCGMPLHRHASQDETHYILRGRYVFHYASHRQQAEAGAIVHVPAGVAHSFWNIGAEPGEMLCMVTPCGPLERFMEAVGEPITDPSIQQEPSLELQRLRSIAEQLGGIEFVDIGSDR